MIVIPCLSKDDKIELSERTDSIPELECPFCHKRIRPIFKYALFKGNELYGYAKRFVVSFPCCNGTYFVKGNTPFNDSDGGALLAGLEVENLQLKQNDDIPEAVKKVSPSFVQIYNESRAAHNHGLTQIVGGGYRKALEFLVRDYAIKQDPNNESSIRTMLLGTCISEYLNNNPDLRAIADRVSWLGNDEVHFTKEWKDKDIEDMSFMLESLISMIDREVRCKEYIQNMPKKEK